MSDDELKFEAMEKLYTENPKLYKKLFSKEERDEFKQHLREQINAPISVKSGEKSADTSPEPKETEREQDNTQTGEQEIVEEPLEKPSESDDSQEPNELSNVKKAEKKPIEVTGKRPGFLSWIWNHKTWIIIIVILAALIILAVLINAKTDETVTDVVQKQRVIKDTVPISNEISFKDLGDPYAIEGTEAKLKGFLVRYSEDGIYHYGISDDFGNIIEFERLERSEMDIFPLSGKSSQIYEITGNFTRFYKTTKIDLQTMGPSTRDEKTTTTQKIEYYNETVERKVAVPRYPGVKSFFDRLFGVSS